MAKTELQKLNRAELLELLVEQTERADRLAAELKETKEMMRDREDLLMHVSRMEAAAAKLIKAAEAGVLAKPQPQQKAAAPQKKPAAKPQPQVPQKPKTAAAKPAQQQKKVAPQKKTPTGSSWTEIIQAVKQGDAAKSSGTAKPAPKTANGIDVSAIMSITKGIGKF